MPLMLLKSVLFGLLAALLGPIVLMVSCSVAIHVVMPAVGSVGFMATHILLVAIASFLFGSAWMYRRLRRRVAR